MNDNVVPIGGITYLDLPALQVLDEAREYVSDDGLLVVGWDKDGDLFVASTTSDAFKILWLLERAKVALFESVEE